MRVGGWEAQRTPKIGIDLPFIPHRGLVSQTFPFWGIDQTKHLSYTWIMIHFGTPGFSYNDANDRWRGQVVDTIRRLRVMLD